MNRRSETTRRLRKRVAKFVASRTRLKQPDLSSPYLCQALVLIRTAGCVVLLRSKTKRPNPGTITVTLAPPGSDVRPLQYALAATPRESTVKNADAVWRGLRRHTPLTGSTEGSEGTGVRATPRTRSSGQCTEERGQSLDSERTALASYMLQDPTHNYNYYSHHT